MTDGTDLERAAAGDEDAFTRLVAPLRAELQAHCYRMLGSMQDAEDAVQDTLLRAWKGISRFERRSSVRTWMYAVATHSCLDAARSRKRRALPMDLTPASEHTELEPQPRTDVAWLEPFPDERYELKESVELAFIAASRHRGIAASRHLPACQRATLIMSDVLGYSAAETANALDTTPASVTSALQRARATLGDGLPERPVRPDRGHRQIVTSFAEALERGDADAVVALLARDVAWSMPPLPQWYQGHAAVAAFARAVPLGNCGRWRARITTANNRPAFALWSDRDGDGVFRAWAITACTVTDDRLTELTSFLGAQHFAMFGLPTTL